MIDPEIRLHYIEALRTSESPKGTNLLIHGFPETSYPFRHEIKPLANTGSLVLAPDYRGAGYSSHPRNGYTKDIMSQDLHQLVTERIGVKGEVYLVGHDIGGMIAHDYVAQFPSSVASIDWGEYVPCLALRDTRTRKSHPHCGTSPSKPSPTFPKS
ncbi:MAG: hypothetical protein Q9164_004046 [Protoblastenia rupestris]